MLRRLLPLGILAVIACKSGEPPWAVVVEAPSAVVPAKMAPVAVARVASGEPCSSPRACATYCDIGWEEALTAKDVECDPEEPSRCTGGKMPPGRCAGLTSRLGCHGWLDEMESASTGRTVLRTKWLCVN